MRGHFLYLRFKTFPMTSRTPQCEVFWALLSNSKRSGVPEDSKSPTLEVLGFTPTLGQSGVATLMVGVSRVIIVAAFSRYWPILGCMAELDVVLQVTSPREKQLHPLENVHPGQFAFTSKESGKYVACFWLQSAHPNVHLNLALD